MLTWKLPVGVAVGMPFSRGSELGTPLEISV